MRKQWKQCQTLFLGGSKITADGDCSHEIKRHFLLGRKVMTNLDSILKSRDITLPKGPYSQSYCFAGSHVRMWGVDHKEGWAPKNWSFWIVSFSPLNCQVSIFISAGPVPGSMPEKKVLPKYFFWTVMLEKTLENTMDCKKIKPVNPKGNLPWIFIGRTDAEAEAPVLFPPAAKS